jgi:hypothetical protein
MMTDDFQIIFFVDSLALKISLLQAMEAHRVARG